MHLKHFTLLLSMLWKELERLCKGLFLLHSLGRQTVSAKIWLFFLLNNNVKKLCWKWYATLLLVFFIFIFICNHFPSSYDFSMYWSSFFLLLTFPWICKLMRLQAYLFNNFCCIHYLCSWLRFYEFIFSSKTCWILKYI